MIELLLEAESALSLGRLDRAELLYRQVVESDPRNSIAVVGLARVTLERGDEAGALKLARRALTIDPENVAAQRLAQRLEEVLRFRGADVIEPAVGAPAGRTAPPAASGDGSPSAPPEPAGPADPADKSDSSTPAPGQEDPPDRRRSWLDRLRRRT